MSQSGEERSIFVENLEVCFKAGSAGWGGGWGREACLGLGKNHDKIVLVERARRGFGGKIVQESEVHTLLMVPLEESLCLSRSSCNKKSNHLLGLLSVRTVRRKSANEAVKQSQVHIVGKACPG